MIIRVIDAVNEAVGRVVCLLSLVFAGIIIFDVVMRYVFNAPTSWAFDLSRQIYGYYFILLGGYALRHQAHVRVDLLIELMTPTVRRIVEIAGYAVFFFPFAYVFLMRSYDFAATSYQQGETTYGAIALPVYPLKIAMCVAAALLFLQGIAEVLRLILEPDSSHTAEIEREAPHGT